MGPLDDALWAGWAVAALELDDELDDDEELVEALDWLADVGAAAGAPDELHAWRIGAAIARMPSDVTSLLRETITFSILTSLILSLRYLHRSDSPPR